MINLNLQIADPEVVRDNFYKVQKALESGGMVYPDAGIPVSTGSAWGTSIPNGTDGKVLTMVAGVAAWASPAATPAAGITGQIQFNNAGSFGADGDLFWDKTAKALLIGGSTSNGSKIQILKNSIGVTNDAYNGISLINSTAASLGNQQNSPSLYLEGQGWKTSGVAASQSAGFEIKVAPSQGSTQSRPNLKFIPVANGVYGNEITLSYDGSITALYSSFYQLATSSIATIGSTLTVQGPVKGNGSLIGSVSATLNAFSAEGAINSSSGTKLWRGLYIAPTIGAITGGSVTIIGIEQADGSNLLNTNSGSTGIGVSTISASAILEIASTTKGILIPRMSSSARSTLSAPATSLLVFDTTLKKFAFWNGTAWEAITSTLI